MTTEVDLDVPLRIADLRAARDPVKVVVGAQARERVTAARTFLSAVLGDDRAVYGATTGFGALVGYAGRADLRDQADNTLAHLGAGQGPELDPEVVRATLLLRAASLARGASGVSPHVIDALAAMLATTFVPVVPRLGSVGASGDLIPLGAAAQALRGRGHAYLDGVRLPAAEALQHCSPDEAILGLIAAAKDKSATVQTAAKNSLVVLGQLASALGETPAPAEAT